MSVVPAPDRNMTVKRTTYIDARGKLQIGGKVQLKPEMIRLRVEPSFSAKYSLIFKQRCKAISIVFGNPTFSLSRSHADSAISDARLVFGVILEDLKVSEK